MDKLVSAEALQRLDAAADACATGEAEEQLPADRDATIDFTAAAARTGPTESLADRARRYLERRQLREEQHRVEEEERSRIGLRDRPEINRNSARLAAERGRGGDVAHALYAEAEAQRRNREALAAELVSSALLNNPAITKQAAELVRDGSVSERLYQQAVDKNKRHAGHGAARSEHSANAADHSPGATKKPQRVPIDGTRAGLGDEAARARRSETAVKHTEALYQRALEMREKREVEQQELEMRLRKGAKPKLSTKTKQIAAELGQSSAERLLQSKTESLRDMARKHSQGAAHGEELTFKPRINPKSKQILRDGRPAEAAQGPTHDRLYKEHSSRVARRSSMSSMSFKSREEKALEECTFRPMITPFEPQAHTEADKGGRQSIADRLVEWEQKRAARLEQQRKLKEQEGLGEEYTFAPKTNASRVGATAPKGRRASLPSGGPPSARSGSGGEAGRTSISGIDRHLERQRKAREERERKQLAHSARPKWTNKLTVPVAPRLGTAHRSEERVASNPESDAMSPPPPPPPPPPTLAQMSLGRAENKAQLSSRPSRGDPPLAAVRLSPKRAPVRAPPPPPPDEVVFADGRVESRPKSVAKSAAVAAGRVATESWRATPSPPGNRPPQMPRASAPATNQQSSPKSPEETLQGFRVLSSLLT